MNRIYRLIWNTALNCWMVASEHTRGRGKQTRRATTLVATLVLMSGAAASELTPEPEEDHPPAVSQWWLTQATSAPIGVFATVPSARSMIEPRAIQYKQQLSLTSDTNYQNSVISGDNLVVLGSRSMLSGERSVAYGNGILAFGKNNVAVGDRASLGYSYGTAVGAEAYASGGDGATAYGNQSRASGRNSIAIGSAAKVETGGGISGIAIGADSRAGSIGWSGAMALGGGAVAQFDGIALGHDASVTASGAIALGRSSVADQGYTVSVGNATTRRRIVNVADGNINATSTDAVTGKQLHATNQTVANIKTNADAALAKVSSAKTALGQSATATGVNATSVGVGSAASGNYSTASGNGASAAGGYGVAVGSSSVASQASAVALGNAAAASAGNAVAVGRLSKSEGTSAVALGNEAAASGNYTTAIGNQAKAGSAWTNAIGYQAEATGSSSVALGSVSKALADHAIALGDRAQVNATANNSMALGRGSSVSAGATGAVALGYGSVAGVGNTVSVGSTTVKRKIVNVGDGVVSATSSEAVTGKQLHGTQQAADEAGTKATAASTAATAATATANTAKTTADSAIARLNNARTQLGQNATATGTNATALGYQASAAGSHSNAVGHAATSAGANAIAMGTLSAGAAEASVALGNRAAVDATSGSGVALGNTAKVNASAAGAVALGANSVATAANTVSVGSGTLRRKIVNVADGALAAGSADAATSGQLYTTNQQVAAVSTTANAAKSAADAARVDATSALGKANALGGLVAQVAPAGNVRLGGENTGTTLDVRNKSNANRVVSGVANGALTAVSTEAVTGNQLFKTNQDVATVTTTANTAKNTADAARVDATSALGKANALGGLVAQVAPAGNVRLGGENTGTTLDVRNKSNANRVVSGVASGAVTAASTEAVAGKQLYETNQEVGRVKASADSAGLTATTALSKADALGGLVSQGTAASSVRLGGENTGLSVDVRNKANASRVITGVSEGSLGANSTDAVNGKQLNATNLLLADQGRAVLANAQSISGNRTSIEGNQTGIGTNRGDIASNRTSIGANRDDIAALRSEFDDFAPDLEGVVTFNEDRTIVDMEGARLTGIRDGDIGSADSKDAVTGGQLFATNRRVSEMEIAQSYTSIGDTLETDGAAAGVLAIAIGPAAEASLDSEGGVAVGAFASAQGKNSVALGRAARVAAGAEEGFALGVRSIVNAEQGMAFGGAAQVLSGAKSSVALGFGAIATEANTVSVGDNNLKRRIVNVGRGTNDDDATTIGQLKDTLNALGGGAEVGADGAIINPTYNVQNGTQNSVGDALVALDGAVVATLNDVTSLDSRLNRLFREEASARADGPGRLILGGAQGMVLGNVANGMIAADSRDAVNGGQLYATNQQVGQNRDAISGLRDELNGSSQRGARGLMNADGRVVDFGGARLAGVGAGDISSADSKDAVNGGQLYATNQRVDRLAGQQRFIAIGVDNDSEDAIAGTYAIAVGSNSIASGERSLALGSYAEANGFRSVALGAGSYVSASGLDGFALGAYSLVDSAGGLAIGVDSQVRSNARNSVALGYGSTATEANTVSIGNTSIKRRIVNVANGTADHDAATVGQLKRIASAFGGSIGVDANGNPAAPSFNVQGGEYRSVGDALSALDSSVNDADKSIGALDNRLNRLFQEETSARTDGPGRLTLGGAQGMVLGNVANGMIASGSRDAVNGGQLYEVRKDLQGQIDNLSERGTERVAISGRMGTPAAMSVGGAGEAIASQDAPATSPAPTPVASDAGAPEPVVKAEGETAVAVGSEGKERSIRHVAKGSADTDAVNVAQLNDVLDRATEYTDIAVEGLNKRLDGMDKRFNRMAAMSSAQSAMAMNTAGLNTYNRLGAGVGHSDGESALAVGYQRVLNERGSATFSLNGAFTNSGEKTVGVGVGIGW